jgi:hypothetical protein
MALFAKMSQTYRFLMCDPAFRPTREPQSTNDTARCIDELLLKRRFEFVADMDSA